MEVHHCRWKNRHLLLHLLPRLVPHGLHQTRVDVDLALLQLHLRAPVRRLALEQPEQARADYAQV